MNKIEQYRKLNRSFKKELVFNLGSEMGFYSEFNNMVFAMLYCLKYEYRFILYSADANFREEKGWEDFFEPFGDSTSFSFHKKYNKRLVKPILSRRDLPLLYLYKFLNPQTFFTYQLFDKFYNAQFEKEEFDIPGLDIKGNLKEASRQLVKMIYQFNADTNKKISGLISSLKLPEKFVSLNIRRGDKNTEFKFVALQAYMDKLKAVTNIKSVFILTDDHGVIEVLRLSYPEFSFFSFVEKSENGYRHNDFMQLTNEAKKLKILKLFAAIETICTSDLFVGTFTANTGLFIALRMPENKVFSIQKSSWYQFELDDVKSFLVL